MSSNNEVSVDDVGVTETDDVPIAEEPLLADEPEYETDQDNKS